MKRFKDYDDAVSYILQIPRFSAKNDMDATKAFLEIIGEAKGSKLGWVFRNVFRRLHQCPSRHYF